MDRPHDVIHDAVSDVVERLRRDAGYAVRIATPAERRRFVEAFVTVLVREARRHGAPHDKGEPCVFSSRGQTSVDNLAATQMLADRIRRRGRVKSIAGQGLAMGLGAGQQWTERPIEIALRKAGRRVPLHPSGRRWDRIHGGFVVAIQNALLESEQMAKEPWRAEVDYVPDWLRLRPAADGRVTRVGDYRAMRNGQFFYEVTRHLLSSVTHRSGEREDPDEKDVADLAEQIRRRYFEKLGAKLRQVWDIESRRWAEAEFGLAPGSIGAEKP